MIQIPEEVLDWLRGVFRKCNEQASLKLTRIPNSHEEWLDLAVIENPTQVSVPVRFGGDWTVRINTHFLGSSPLYRNWEIADIGVLVMFSSGGQLVRSKVALLQSKRLYADEQEAESPVDFERRYMEGFGRLFARQEELAGVAEERQFRFAETSRYKALIRDHHQYTAITDYEVETQIPVYYLFYNPWTLPLSVTVPLTSFNVNGECEIGCRVAPSEFVRKIMSAKGAAVSPSYADLKKRLPKSFKGEFTSGWPLEYFVVDLLLQCKAGRITDIRNDPGLYRVSNRRSGAIAAAFAITLDAPAGFDWAVEPE